MAHCGGLDAKMVPLHGAASGTTFADLVVTNHGTTACTLPAQPALEYFGATHQPLPVEFSSDPDLKPYTPGSGRLGRDGHRLRQRRQSAL